jgi:Rrf2 family transcriptional regulator, iron-sulfur cluster assembly transcription factor
MMELTRKGEYAMRGMIYLAGLPPAKTAFIGEIAEAAEAPRNFMSKIMQSLVKAGLVKSYRGAKGGFALAMPASDITMRHIVVASDGPILPNRCLLHRGACSRDAICAVHCVWQEVMSSVITILDRATLAKLARP